MGAFLGVLRMCLLALPSCFLLGLVVWRLWRDRPAGPAGLDQETAPASYLTPTEGYETESVSFFLSFHIYLDFFPFRDLSIWGWAVHACLPSLTASAAEDKYGPLRRCAFLHSIEQSLLISCSHY